MLLVIYSLAMDFFTTLLGVMLMLIELYLVCVLPEGGRLFP